MNTMWNNKLILNREQIQNYDKIAMEQFGIPSISLMENAGSQVANTILKAHIGQKAALICGPGNNGGDGFVVARFLLAAGCEVTIFSTGPISSMKPDCKINFDILTKINADIVDISTEEKVSDFGIQLKEYDYIVDAILGTGLTRKVEGLLSQIIKTINEAQKYVFCIDIPSGLECNLGTPLGETVKGTCTITLAHLKTGLLLYPGANFAGHVEVVPIGVPAQISKLAGNEALLLNEPYIKKLFLKRENDSYKGTFGHLLLMAGSKGKTGAAMMASNAAMRSGVGLVTIATSSNAAVSIEAQCIESMVETVIEKPDSALNERDINRLESIIEGKSAIALGPGLTTAKGIGSLAIKLLQTIKIPAIIDADGINILANDPSAAAKIKAPLILTPHLGEMSRLCKKSISDIKLNKISISKEIAKRYNAIIVLKGPNTIIATPDEQIFINPTGNSGMATGGCGDVLTGIIGAFLAQGLTPLNATLAGVYIHGKAGDMATKQKGKTALIATDIITELPNLFKSWE